MDRMHHFEGGAKADLVKKLAIMFLCLFVVCTLASSLTPLDTCDLDLPSLSFGFFLSIAPFDPCEVPDGIVSDAVAKLADWAAKWASNASNL